MIPLRGQRVPCEVFVDSGEPYTLVSNMGNVCAQCRWAETAHTDEVRAIMRGESPESVPDGSGGFYRRQKWGSPTPKDVADQERFLSDSHGELLCSGCRAAIVECDATKAGWRWASSPFGLSCWLCRDCLSSDAVRPGDEP